MLTWTASTTSSLWSPPSCNILSSHWLYDHRFLPSLYALQQANIPCYSVTLKSYAAGRYTTLSQDKAAFEQLVWECQTEHVHKPPPDLWNVRGGHLLHALALLGEQGAIGLRRACRCHAAAAGPPADPLPTHLSRTLQLCTFF